MKSQLLSISGARMVRCILLLTSVAGLVGCSGAPQPPPLELTPVRGVVKLDGEPLPFADIAFEPSDMGTNSENVATGISDEKGQFSLTTKGSAGAVPGKFRVFIRESSVPDNVFGDRDKEKEHFESRKNRPIPKKFSSRNTSDVVIEVKRNQDEYIIELSRSTSAIGPPSTKRGSDFTPNTKK